MAPSRVVAAGAHRYRVLPRRRAAGRGRPVRFDLPRRPARAGRHRGARRQHVAGADHDARCARRLDAAHRPDRHGLDHLHRALQSRPPVRLARPYQRRPGRLEHRDLVARAGRAQLRRHGTGEPRRALRARRGVHVRSRRRCGTAGPTMPCSTIARAATMRAPTASGRSTTRASIYHVAGPLNMPRGPQGRPVFVQAGSSDTGRRFAARHAEAVFTAQMEKSDGAGVLCRPEDAGGGRGPAVRAGADPARPQPDDRLDRGRGQAARTAS